MRFSIEIRALGWAAAAAVISLGGALLIALPIERSSGAMTSLAPAAPPQIASPALLALGSKDFAQTCADCHGDDAHGDEGPDLHNLAISTARIAATIHNGVKGEMPSFAKRYDGPQVAALTAYLRSLH